MEPADESNLRQRYEESTPQYRKLITEVEQCLRDGLEKYNIKYHSVKGRLKEFESIVSKIDRKYYAAEGDEGVSKPPHLGLIDDIVGIRVVCLLFSDLSRISDFIFYEFSNIYFDDKIYSSEDSFGYMSIHFICKIKDEYNGPHYDDIKGVHFEIQLRTISMDAWASLSHFLSYKGEGDVPSELKKSLNALSALFFVADSQFDSFYENSSKYKEKASKEILSERDLDINIDTLSAFLKKKYPDRSHHEGDSLSSLIEDLRACGIVKTSELEVLLDKYKNLFLYYERGNPPNSVDNKNKNNKRNKYADVGVVRLTLKLISDKNLKSINEIRNKNGAHIEEGDDYRRAREEFNKIKQK